MQIELTKTQITQTLDAETIINSWNGDECELGYDSWSYDESDVKGVGDTLADFIKHNGQPAETVELERIQPDLRGYKWEEVQSAKGKRRGDLIVVDFGDVRACIFTGEF